MYDTDSNSEYHRTIMDNKEWLKIFTNSKEEKKP